MRVINVKKKTIVFLSLMVLSILLPLNIVQGIDKDGLGVSYPVSYGKDKEILSYPQREEKIANSNFIVHNNNVYRKTKDGLIDINFNEGLMDKNKKEFYFTIKSQTSWGSEKYIYVYSLPKKVITKKIEFDNSGYEKFPVAISPDSKVLALAESPQSVGEVNIILIDIDSGKEVQKLSNLYSPSLVFQDNTSIIYLEPALKCKEERCIQDAINIKKLNLKTSIVRAQRIAEKDDIGSFPQLDNIEIIDENVKLNSRLNEFSQNNKKKEWIINLNF